MSNFKMFDGTNWIDICDCDVHIKTSATWNLLDPWNCVTKYWDGSNWCEVICCTCPDGYIYDPINRECTTTEIIPATPSGGTTYPVDNGDTSIAYGVERSRLYEDISAKTFPLNGWQNTSICLSCTNGYQVFDNAGLGVLTTISALSVVGNTVFSNISPSTTGGRLNASGIWATGYPLNQWLNVEFCITIDVTKTYIFAIAGDNQIKAGITSTTFNGGVTNLNLVNLWGSASPTGTPTNSGYPNSFKIWHMFPITLPAGVHTLQLSGMDFGTPSAFGAEIYDISEANMMTLMANPTLTNADLQPFIIFSSSDLVTTPPLIIGSPLSPVTWTCPDGYTLTGCFGVPSCVTELTAPCEGVLCSIYSQRLEFGSFNSIQYMCSGRQIAACYDTGAYANITDLVNLFNTPQPSPLPAYCNDPTFCLCWANYGTYYDNGDGRIRLELTPEALIELGCPCEDLSMQIIRD